MEISKTYRLHLWAAVALILAGTGSMWMSFSIRDRGAGAQLFLKPDDPSNATSHTVSNDHHPANQRVSQQASVTRTQSNVRPSKSSGSETGTQDKSKPAKQTFLKFSYSSLVQGLSTIVVLVVSLITFYVLVKAFQLTPDVNPQDSEKTETTEENRWQIIYVLAVLCLYMKSSSCILVAGQEPMQKALVMNLFEYNSLLGARCMPGLLATLVAPSLQRRFDAPHVMFGLSLVYALGTFLQAVAIWAGSLKVEVIAVLLIEGTTGAVVAITAALCARSVSAEEQSRAVTIVSIFTLLGMATPLVIMPWAVELAGLTLVAGIGNFLGGVLGSLSGFAFFRLAQGGALDDLLQDEVHTSFFSSGVWMQGQALCIIVIMSLINGVAMTLGENITHLLSDHFNLQKAEIGLVTFIGFISCVAAQVFGIVLDAKGGRPIANIVAAFAVATTICLGMAHSNPVVAVILWGVGYSLNLNAGFSSFALIVPDEKLSLIMVLATAGNHVGFISIPFLYGYYANFHSNHGLTSLLLLLTMAVVLLVGLSAYSIQRSKGTLFGIRKYEETEHHTEPEMVDAMASSG